MSQRVKVVFVLVGLLVLMAGCSGSSDEGTTTTLDEAQTTTLPSEPPTPTETTTLPEGPSTTAETTTLPDNSITTNQQIGTTPTTQTETDRGLPPLASRDWMADGHLNQSALFLRHIEAFRGASGYQIHSNFTYTLENGSQRVTTFRTLVDSDQAVLKTKREDGWFFNQSFFNRRYVNESAEVIVQEYKNGTVLRRSSSSPSEPLEQTVRRMPVEDTGFAFGINLNWTADGRTVLDDEPVYRYRGVELVGSSPFTDQATLSSATMLVDRDGRIRRIAIQAQGEFSFVGIDRRLPATFSFEVALSDLNNTTVEVPPWVATER